jgi:hypothetical protein
MRSERYPGTDGRETSRPQKAYGCGSEGMNNHWILNKGMTRPGFVFLLSIWLLQGARVEARRPVSSPGQQREGLMAGLFH